MLILGSALATNPYPGAISCIWSNHDPAYGGMKHMKKTGIAIVGAGVAGSVLARLLLARTSEAGQNITIYDISRSYVKPCGEVVPARLVDSIVPSLGIPRPRVLNSIRRFVLSVGSETVREYKPRSVIWYSIDKSEWINSLRDNFNVVYKGVNPANLVSRYGVVVDARGPFSSRGRKIVVWRAYAENPGLERDMVYIIMSSRNMGLVWIFPHSDKLNVGGGFIGINNPRDKVIRTLYDVIGTNLKLYSEAYSLVTVYPKIQYTSPSGIVRIGEAAGLIMSLGGEGIRPAVLSAAALANALELDRDYITFHVDRYISSIRGIVKEVKLHSLMLRLASVIGDVGLKRILRNVDEEFIEAWLQGRLTSVKYLVKSLYALVRGYS